MLARRRILLALISACATACGAVEEAVRDLLDSGEDTDVVADTEPSGDAARDDVPQAPAPDVGRVPTPQVFAPLQRSDKKYPFPAKGGANIGFRIDTLADHYALAGTVEVPEWSAAHEGEPELVRDDDLDTAWTCTPRGENRCAIGIHFPTAATLGAVQVFAATGTDPDRFEAHPRPKRLRIHTAEGFLDALLPDDNSHVYAVFGKPIVSSEITLEVMEVWKGRSSKIHIAELEVFGLAGEPREPLEIDPERTFVGLEEPPWRRGGRDAFERQTAFIYRIDDDGRAHRFIDGTAIRGKAGDRLHLVERVQSVTGCETPRGTFHLLDTKTRLVAPLGEFGGVGGDVYRAVDGLGVATGYVGDRTVLDGLFAGDGEYHRRRTPLREDKRADDFVTQWGLDRTPLPRGAVPLAKAGCEPGTDALLQELAGARAAAGKERGGRKKGKDSVPADPAQWHVCELAEGARAFLTDHGPCGPAWEVHVLDAKGTLVDGVVQPRIGSHLGLRELGEGTLLVQAAGASDLVALLKVTAAGIDTFAESASIALEPPEACRSVCDAGFSNPHAPSWE